MWQQVLTSFFEVSLDKVELLLKHQTDLSLTNSSISYTRCLQVLSKPVFNPFVVIIVIVSFSGVVLNYINFHYIFHFKSRFHQLLKFYSFCSFLLCVSIVVNGIVGIFFPQFRFTVGGYWMGSMRLFSSYIFITFGSILDTYIIFERLKIFNPKFKISFIQIFISLVFLLFKQ